MLTRLLNSGIEAAALGSIIGDTEEWEGTNLNCRISVCSSLRVISGIQLKETVLYGLWPNPDYEDTHHGPFRILGL